MMYPSTPVQAPGRSAGERLRALWMCALLLVMNVAHGQLDNVMVYGTVKDMTSAKKLDGATVTVFKNGAKLVDVFTNASGKYEVNLDYGSDYKIMWSKSGFVGKNITINTKEVPEEERNGGHGMNIDITMMAELSGVDYSILLEPFGKAKYDKATGNFEWDIDYTTRMRDAQAKLLKEYEERKKREANAEAEFAKAMAAGTAAMTAGDFKKAVEQFTSALELKPKEPVATAKLSDAQMRLEQQQGDAKLEAEYAALIKEADGLFTRKEYEPAKAKYQAALGLKEELHPKTRMKEIDTILADLAKKAEEERKAKELLEKYQAAIAAADAAFKAENWDQATAKYTEASGVKPEEKYPKDQLAAVAVKKAEAAKKAEEERKAKELQEKYLAAISAGDVAFKASNWDLAQTKYTEASGLKPEEKYPKDQLAAILTKRDEAARKAEEERLAKELQQKYQAAVTAADAAFKAERLDEAEGKYTEASGLKPEEKYPKDQLAAIVRKRDELAKKASEEEQAKALDAKYQAAISAGDGAFNSGRWDEAEQKYAEAGGLKPAEKYPKDQLAAVARKREEEAKRAEDERKQQELDARYQAAISAADAAFEKSDWAAAKAKYTEASGVKPTEQYPKDRIAEADRRAAEAAEQARQTEIDARYNALIAEADGAFDRKELEAAKGKYQEALKVKANEAHPTQRIQELDRLIADAARAAEEERKRQELEARYAGLIASADKAFDAQQFSAALNDYKDALQLKPGERHPQDRIAAIEQQLDAAAKAKAEEERLLREQQDRDKRYGDLITAADKAFTAKRYDEARTSYGEALGVKPGEAHPTQRLEEIERLLKEQADKAEADRLKAEQDASERARQAEADRLAAELAAAEQARLAEEQRKRDADAAALESQFRELVAAGDLAFSQDQLDRARDKFTEALGVKPGAPYPTERIAAIDAELKRRSDAMGEAERLAEERRRAEEDRKRQEAEAAEAARLAADAAEAERLRAEEERRRREAEEARKRQSEEERERADREARQALEQRYSEAILAADAAMGQKSWTEARGLYAQASDLKPEETYPLAKIDQIDKLMAEEERARAEAELAAQKAREAQEQSKPRSSSTIDARKEEEAESFLRALREREEAEKYERIKKFRSELEAEEQDNATAAAERRDGAVTEKERLEEASAGLYVGSEEDRMRNAEDMARQKERIAEQEAQRRETSDDKRTSTYESTQRVSERIQERERTWSERHTQQVEQATASTERILSAEERRVEQSAAQREQRAAQVDAQREANASLAARGNASLAVKQQQVEAEKQAAASREAARQQAAADQRERAKEVLDNTSRVQPRSFADHTRSKLAMDYPQGVTEESYTEGNKVIIRRVVVNGNRADEYSKVIAKWGTFYFKNGQSITSQIWTKETEGE